MKLILEYVIDCEDFFIVDKRFELSNHQLIRDMANIFRLSDDLTACLNEIR